MPQSMRSIQPQKGGERALLDAAHGVTVDGKGAPSDGGAWLEETVMGARVSQLVLRPLLACMIGAGAMAPPAQSSEVRELMIQFRGQLAPFDEFAVNTVRELTGTSSFAGYDPVEMVLEIVARPGQWEDRPCLRVESPALQERLGLATGERYVSLRAWRAAAWTTSAVAAALHRVSEGRMQTAEDRAVIAVQERCLMLQALMDQELNMVPPLEGERRWLPILRPEGYPADQQVAVKRVWARLLTAIREKRPDRAHNAAQRLRSVLGNMQSLTAAPTPLRLADVDPL